MDTREADALTGCAPDEVRLSKSAPKTKYLQAGKIKASVDVEDRNEPSRIDTQKANG